MGTVEDKEGTIGSKVNKYQGLHPQLYDLEASLTEEWFSPELMVQLRSENLRATLSADRSLVVRQIQAQIVAYLKGASFNSRRLGDIVNFIKQSESHFEEWHSSNDAKLFSTPVFRNKKKNAGYFF